MVFKRENQQTVGVLHQYGKTTNNDDLYKDNVFFLKK